VQTISERSLCSQTFDMFEIFFIVGRKGNLEADVLAINVRE
jgi:hypothetical protein